MAEYNLEERSFQFAKKISLFTKSLPRSFSNTEYSKQVIKSSASIGSNYIEANESLGKKDFLMHLRISRKEAKESRFWLRLILETNDDFYKNACNELINEATELKKIFSAIIEKSK